jgi:sugar (pentulose or hexulose) kinase
VTGKPVRAARTVDVANWGACLLAGLGAGMFPDAPHLPASADAEPCLTPQPGEVQRYQELYEAYLEGEPE